MMSNKFEKELENIIEQITSDSKVDMLKGVTACRRLLSIEKNPPIQIVIDCGFIIPLLVDFLSNDDQHVSKRIYIIYSRS